MKNLILFLSLLGLSLNLKSQTIRVAIAANIQSVMKEIQTDFTKKNNIELELVSGASGNLANQIRNGAPFELFLSADLASPESLYKEGLCFNEVKIYARGSLIICSHSSQSLKTWKNRALTDSIKKIGLANPQIAPYGKAAMETLKKEGIYDKVKDKLIQGESISQVNTYITNGLVDLGFTAKSLVLDPNLKQNLYWEAINPKNYSPIDQGMVLIKTPSGKPSPGAQLFYKYLLSPSAKAIFKRYGYLVK